MTEEKGCSNCRYQMTGWDGGFFGLPLTCECKIFGETENRDDCLKFKRPYPKGFSLLLEFREWYNEQYGEVVIAIDEPSRFWREWE